MNKVAKFEKVSYEQFKKDCYKEFCTKGNLELPDGVFEECIEEFYKNIKLPKRSTTGSAGYDFFLPFNISLRPNESITIPTGIRCKIEDGWVLKMYPRSGHGFKYGIHLANSVGIIDADYFDANNEGHIQIKLVNDSVLAESIECIYLDNNTAFCQGIFLPFGITMDDEVEAKRVGGFGSTDNK